MQIVILSKNLLTILDQQTIGINTMATVTTEIWLIGFSINPDTEYPDLYTLFFPGETDEPLVVEDYIIFFSKPELAAKALKLSAKKEQFLDALPQEVDMVCEIADTLYKVNHQDIDPDATIINCLNILLDLVKAIKLPIPEEYKRVLYTLADHLTFNREISTFYTNEQVSKLEVTNAILWCLGAILSKSKLVT